MDNQEHKNTWNNFTKFVFFGTALVILILIILAITLFFFLYVNSEDGSFRENGIVEIKTNLQNYKIIPKDKGGIKMPCLEILECEKE